MSEISTPSHGESQEDAGAPDVPQTPRRLVRGKPQVPSLTRSAATMRRMPDDFIEGEDLASGELLLWQALCSSLYDNHEADDASKPDCRTRVSAVVCEDVATVVRMAEALAERTARGVLSYVPRITNIHIQKSGEKKKGEKNSRKYKERTGQMVR